MNIISKLPEQGTSIFTVMSAMALEHGAINLSQGFPEFEVSPELVDRIYHYMTKGHNQYAPMPGTPQLRKEIARVTEENYGRKTDENNEITIFSGATEALFSSITTLIHPGDEVILFDPAYDSYDPAIKLSGGIPIHIELSYPDFTIPWNIVREKISSKTKLIIINTPHNPTGTVLSEGDMKELIALVKEHDLWVLSDEVYEWIIFDNKSHVSVLKYPELKDRSIAVFSFGKTFHATGWKMGYAIAGESLTKELRKVHQFVTFSVNTPIQLAMADHLKVRENYTSLPDLYQPKRDHFLNLIKDLPLTPLTCSGTYFQLLSYAGISDEDDRTFSEKMTKEWGVAVIPVSVFYEKKTDHKLIRVCFAKNQDTLDKAVENIRKNYRN
ncbi:MAG: methionine aminotransferase [Cyclobacteriaceae bacterium]|nr:methionine aminotransferase [Cyclobacteriaceae bacterium]